MEIALSIFSRKPKESKSDNQRLDRITTAEHDVNKAPNTDSSPLIDKPTDIERTTGLKDVMTNKRRGVHKIQFRTLASDRPSRSSGSGSDKDIENARIVLRKVFSPSAPILDIDCFAGRVKEITRAVSAIENEGMHLVIHGKRGLGKTSFSNTLCQIARQAGYIVCSTSSSQNSSYSDIFRSFLKEVPLLYDQNFVTNHGVDTRQECFDTLLPEGDFSPKELTKILLRLASTRLLFVIDEFDRNKTDDFKDCILETIKNFSDSGVRSNLILIGATDTVDELIGLNESVRRNISGIPIKVFSVEELEELFDIGEEASDVIFPENVRIEISSLSRNIPHCMKLLCLHSAQAALSQGRWAVSAKDMTIAISLSIMDAQALLDVDLLDLIQSKSSNQFESFLYALAGCQYNDNGEFYAEQAAQAQREQTGEAVTALSIGSRLTMLCNTSPPILSKREHYGKVLYKLNDPTLGFYLRLMQSYGSFMTQKLE